MQRGHQRRPSVLADPRRFVGYCVAMRLHITLDDVLVAELDRKVGARERSRFIAAAVRRVLAEQAGWEAIESALGQLDAVGHDWDDDPAAWVRAQRSADDRRVG